MDIAALSPLARSFLRHLDDLDPDYQIVRVLDKGRVQREVPFGQRTAQAIDRYLRVRARHK